MKLQRSACLAAVILLLASSLKALAGEGPGSQDPAGPYKRFAYALSSCHQHPAIAAALQGAYRDLLARNAVDLPKSIATYQEPYWSVSSEGPALAVDDCRDFIALMRTPAADPIVTMAAFTHQFLVQEKQAQLDAPDAIGEDELAELYGYIATVREHLRQRHGPADLAWELDADPKSQAYGSGGDRNGQAYRDYRQQALDEAAKLPLKPVDLDEGTLVCTVRFGPLALAVVDHVYATEARREARQMVYIKGAGRWWQTPNVQLRPALAAFADQLRPFFEGLERAGEAAAYRLRMQRNSCFRLMGLD